MLIDLGEVEDFRAVEGAGKQQVAAGRVGEAGDHAGAVVDACRGDGGGDTGGADGDAHVAGLQIEAEGGGHVVVCARGEEHQAWLGGGSTRCPQGATTSASARPRLPCSN